MTDVEGRWAHSNKLLRRSSPMAPEGFEVDTKDKAEVNFFSSSSSLASLFG